VMTDNSIRNILDDLGPLYHSYAFFGVNNEQLTGHFQKNQIAKAQIISSYIAWAHAKVDEKFESSVSFAELFCADGYYAMVARSLGCYPVFGIDNNRDGYTDLAKTIASRLGLQQIEFVISDINNNAKLGTYDIVANVGGLYHTENPEEILQLSYEMSNNYLIVQNVVSLANTNNNYFETPAPGWTWGSRYSRESFDNLMQKKFDSKIIFHHFNELTGNSRLEDRGNSMYLIAKNT
jgi:hypothetical protein